MRSLHIQRQVNDGTEITRLIKVGIGPGITAVTNCVEKTVLQTHAGSGLGGGGIGIVYEGLSTHVAKRPKE
jgi:hypothetical protein